MGVINPLIGPPGPPGSATPVDPTDTNPTRNKGVANLDAKHWEDHRGDVTGNPHDVTAAQVGALTQTQAPDTGTVPASATFGSDGSITTVYGSPAGVTVTTSFASDGSISEAFGAPISKTRTTTFGSDGSVNQVVS